MAKPPKPEPLYKEPQCEVRLREIVWILQCSADPLGYEDIFDRYRAVFGPLKKETMLRSMRTLKERGRIVACECPDDRRVTYWSLS